MADEADPGNLLAAKNVGSRAAYRLVSLGAEWQFGSTETGYAASPAAAGLDCNEAQFLSPGIETMNRMDSFGSFFPPAVVYLLLLTTRPLLAEAPTSQLHAAKSSPWVNLFASNSLDNWRTDDGKPVTRGWGVEQGVLFHSGHSGNILTKQNFSDFELKFQWKLAPGANSGVKYRMKDYADRRLGCEYQLIDDKGYKYSLAQWQRTGALYGLYPPPPDSQPHPPGQWNSARIVAAGNHLEHWLNGKIIVSAEAGSDDWKERVLHSKFDETPDFGQNPSGPIMIQDHGGTVWFRNMVVRVSGD